MTSISNTENNISLKLHKQQSIGYISLNLHLHRESYIKHYQRININASLCKHSIVRGNERGVELLCSD